MSLTITPALREHMVKNHGVSADADDAAVKKAAVSAVMSGKLAEKDLRGLQKGTSEKAKDGKGALPDVDPPEHDPNKVFSGAIGGGGESGEKSGQIRVKKATEGYATTKSRQQWPELGRHRKGEYAAGEDAFYWEHDPESRMSLKKPIYAPSEAEQVKMGALFKYFVIRDCGEEKCRTEIGLTMTEHDHALVKEAMHEDNWVGSDTVGLRPRKLYDGERNDIGKKGGLFHKDAGGASMQKATVVLGDTGGLSGGDQAVPQYFDFEAIRIPLLYGELVPYVEITPTDRGSAAHSYSIGTPTFVTTASGTAITPFTTDGFVATFDVPFYPASCAFQWGRDFEMDAAPNFGQMVVAQMGDQFKYQMDNWIAVGNGTTQPQGLNSASGTITVAPTGSSHATMVYNDGVNLAFGVTKPYRKAFGGQNTMFAMRDSMYKKFMQVVTGVTGDARPIYGMHLKDYQLGDYHVAIQNDIADGTVFFANMRGYRMYRRLGLYFELVTTGVTLTLANTKLLFARARFGGKLTLGGYCAKMTNLMIS